MDLAWIRDLKSLSQTENFSRAAQLNNLSQPAFSRRIKALENWVGAILVDRSSHPVKLTEAGRQILDAGTQAINRIEAERDQIRDAQARPDKYLVTFATQHSIGWRFYPAWLQQLESSFGPMLSRLRADDLPNCIDAMHEGEADFVVSYGSEFSSGIDDSPSTESVTIGKDTLLPVCKVKPNAEPLFSIDEDNASPIPYLKFGQHAPIGQHIEPLLSDSPLQQRLEVTYENSMAGALRVRARDGMGVAWLPRSLIQPDLDAGLLAFAGDEKWSIELDIRLHRNTEQTNTLTRKIWRFIAEQPIAVLPPDEG